ncbi:MAG: hypothetical protein KGP28_09625 [Bdellovibrionales bacterium]|nr:hypothetical protein [Bdellovibrionales bacterium]
MNPVHGWNERRSTLEQERRFKRLISLHTLSDYWIRTLSPQQAASHHLERMAKVTLNPNLWQFEKNRLDQLPLNLEELVGAQEIDTFLSELESTIWIIQASTLENAETASSNRRELQNILEQASWNHGKLHAETIWGTQGNLNLREGVEAFLKTHVYGNQSFLKERDSFREITLIWKHSPLQTPSLMDSPVAELLCTLHEHWIRGFFYGASRNTRVECKRTLIRTESFPHLILR